MIKGDTISFDSDNENEQLYVKNKKKVAKCDKIPWVEKYRPKELSDIIYQDEIVKVLKTTIKNGNLPHLLLYGPAGTGKTSTILAVARELFGPNKFSERVIELNASDERGINIVRNKIITFAKLAIGTEDPNYPSPNYKIIILDEADAMTKEAQSALRKIMEDNSSITRFCFICNYINQIIEPINSRCVKFRFRQLNDDTMFKRLRSIAVNEKMNVSNDAINLIIETADGDLRKGIMLLQNLKYITVPPPPANIITPFHIYEMTGSIPFEVINKINKMCFNNVDNVLDIVNLANDIIKMGFPIQNLLVKLNKFVISNDKLDDINHKGLISLTLLKAQKKLAIGADEYIQLLNIFMQIKKTFIV